MKKLLFLVPTIALLAAACNSQPASPQTNQPAVNLPANQQSQQPSPAVIQPGPMPKMTYRVGKSNCVQNNEYTDVTLYADGNLVTTLRAPFCEFTKVEFRAGNSKVVYFSLIPGGLGGYYIFMPVFNLYNLDLEKKTAVKVNTGSYELNSVDFNSDFTKIIYINYVDSSKSWQVITQDMTTNINTNFGSIPIASQPEGQFGHIKFSSDLKKAAIAVGYKEQSGVSGPNERIGQNGEVYIPEYGEIYVLDLTTKNYSLYKRSATGIMQVNGWKNNSEVDWSVVQ